MGLDFLPTWVWRKWMTHSERVKVITENDARRIARYWVQAWNSHDLDVATLTLLIYIYGYLNRVQSSRGLEREGQRNVELMC